MRDRRTIRSTDHHQFEAYNSELVQPPFERRFGSGELDLDDLAEAIRMLLGRDGAPRNNSRSRHNPPCFLRPHE